MVATLSRTDDNHREAVEALFRLARSAGRLQSMARLVVEGEGVPVGVLREEARLTSERAEALRALLAETPTTP